MARTQWAKITTDASTSPSIADVRSEGPVGRDALCIFFLSLAHGGMYGVLPGDLRRFGAMVCPLFNLSPKQLEQRLALLEKHGMVLRYNADGQDFIWLRHYHLFQDIRWFRAGRCPDPLPDDWIVTDELTETLLTELAKPDGNLPSHYGLREVHLRQRPEYSQIVSLTRQRQAMPGNAGDCPQQTRDAPLGTDTDADTDSDSDGDDSRAREDTPPDTDPSDDHLLLSDFPELMDLLTELRGRVWSVRRRQWWVIVLARAARDEHTDVDEDEITAALRENVPDVADRPEAWLTRLLAAKHERTRASPSPGKGAYSAPEDWSDRDHVLPGRESE